MITVGEIRRLLKNVDDDVQVLMEIYGEVSDSNEAWQIDGIQINTSEEGNVTSVVFQ